jgi:hypothetical protein
VGCSGIETNEQAYEAANAFGNFQKLTADLGGARLHETIPSFHDTAKRLDALQAAIEHDPFNRAAEVKPQIEFALARAGDCARVTRMIASGEIPERVTHNDTKLNDVLLDEVSSEGVCVIDLDTTMPGSALYDFGDMVRTATPRTREDDLELGKLDLLMDRFEALVKEYLGSAGSFINDAEIAHLAFSGKLLTLECGSQSPVQENIRASCQRSASTPGAKLPGMAQGSRAARWGEIVVDQIIQYGGGRIGRVGRPF